MNMENRTNIAQKSPKNTRKNEPEKKSLAETHGKAIVVLIGLLYIIGPLIHLNKLVFDKAWYFDTYSYMPKWLMLTRYSFSFFQRIVALITAAGLLRFKEIYRKILIGICIFTMSTVYWKHPYPAFLAHTKGLDIKYGAYLNSLTRNNVKITFEMLTVPSIIVHCLLNIAFCGVVIYFLTRPGIKKLFSK
jgi:hypothetical protein